jgi:hypothetical protein
VELAEDLMRARWVALAAALALVAGCASSSRYESWRGRSIEDLQFAWGPPDRATRLSDGRTMVAYEHVHYVNGISYQCTATFGADVRGMIVTTSTAGNLGGCNALLLSKPAAP